MHRVGGLGRWSILIGFEPRDCWLGAYWRYEKPGGFVYDTLAIYVCVLPMLPVLFHRERSVYDAGVME